MYLGLDDGIALLKGFWTDEVERLEREFAQFVECAYAIGTSFGRSALYLALRAVGVEGVEVLLPALTCDVVTNSVVLAGGKPVFVDVDPNTLGMLVEDASAKITSRTRAIILIHYYGNPCVNTREIVQFAKQNGLIILVDCAHSLGATLDGQPVGKFGDVAVFSLTKNLLNLRGGMLCTSNEPLYRRARDVAESSKYHEKISRQLLNLYRLLSGGYKIAVDRLLYDRIGLRAFDRSWLIELPEIFSHIVIEPLWTLKKRLDGDVPAVQQDVSGFDFQTIRRVDIDRINGPQVPQTLLYMDTLTASIGRSQLRKVVWLTKRRQEIAFALKRGLPEYYRDLCAEGGTSVCTGIPFWFPGKTSAGLVNSCRARGLLLRQSWPAFQEYWPEQQSRNIELIRDHLLWWQANPIVSGGEVVKMITIIQLALAELGHK